VYFRSDNEAKLEFIIAFAYPDSEYLLARVLVRVAANGQDQEKINGISYLSWVFKRDEL
jgi:hypothetical protein